MDTYKKDKNPQNKMVIVAQYVKSLLLINKTEITFTNDWCCFIYLFIQYRKNKQTEN